MPSPVAGELARWLSDPERHRLAPEAVPAARALIAEALGGRAVWAQQLLEAQQPGGRVGLELHRLTKAGLHRGAAAARGGYALRRRLAERYELHGYCLVERGVEAPELCRSGGAFAVVGRGRVVLIGDRGDRLVYAGGRCVYAPAAVDPTQPVEPPGEGAGFVVPLDGIAALEGGRLLLNLGPCSLEEAPRLLRRLSAAFGAALEAAVRAAAEERAREREGEEIARLAREMAGEWRRVLGEQGGALRRARKRRRQPQPVERG